MKVAKNRVQPADSLQAKYFVSRAMTGVNWWQSPFFAPARLLPRAAKRLSGVFFRMGTSTTWRTVCKAGDHRGQSHHFSVFISLFSNGLGQTGRGIVQVGC